MPEKKLNGRTFATTPMLATQAIVLQARLARIVGPALPRLGAMFKTFGKDRTPEEEQESNLAAIAAFADIFAHADPDELAELIKEIIEKAEIRRESGELHSIEFDQDFSGEHLGDIVPMFVWMLQEQFGSFFSGLLALGCQSSKARR